MLERDEHHVAAGSDHGQRWIEAGRLRLEEDEDGALATIQGHVGPAGSWMSATELAGLVRHLGAWFADDPSDAIHEIEASATRVKTALEAWNDRARIDEEHPPYDDLTRALDAILATCAALLDRPTMKKADRR